MVEAVKSRMALRASLITGVLGVFALALLGLGGPVAGSLSIVDGPVPDLVAQFGVSAGTAGTIATALNSPWATALSIALVPIGLGAATLTIRATWTTLVATIGKEAAKKAIQRF